MSLNVLCCYTGHNPGSRHPLNRSLEIPYGLALMATILKNDGHKTEVLVLSPEDVVGDSFRERIAQYEPQLICFSCVSSHFPLVRKIAQAFKSVHCEAYIAVGGPHATLNPESTISCPEIDAVCVGEGEHGIGQLAAQLDSGQEPEGIDNFWLKKRDSGLIQRNPMAPFLDDLDLVPFIDRDMWEPWLENPHTEPAVLLGRGCPNNCRFCCNHKFRKIANGRYVRFRSVPNIIQEIEKIVQTHETDSIYLETETLSSNLDFGFDLCDALKHFNEKRNNPITFRINFSLTNRLARDHEQVDKLLRKFVQANVMHLNIGLESGSERIRQLLRRPNYANEDFIKFCRQARNQGLGVRTYVIIGLPGETLSDWKTTIDVVRRSEPEDVALSIFFPYPGTEAYDMAKKEGLLKKDISDYVTERQEVVIDLPGFSRRRILLEYRLFERKVLAIKGPFKTTWHHRALSYLISIPLIGYAVVFMVDVLNERLPEVRRLVSRWFGYSYAE